MSQLQIESFLVDSRRVEKPALKRERQPRFTESTLSQLCNCAAMLILTTSRSAVSSFVAAISAIISPITDKAFGDTLAVIAGKFFCWITYLLA